MGTTRRNIEAVHKLILGIARRARIGNPVAMLVTHPATELPTPIRDLTAMQAGAITSAQLKDLTSDDGVARLIRTGAVTRLWRGAYAVADRAGELETRLRAADLTLGRTVAPCFNTAAAVFGYDISDDIRTHVLADAESHSIRKNLVEHRHILTAPLVTVGSRQVTDPTETALKVACAQSSPSRMLAVLDAAARSKLTTATTLAAQAQLISANRIRLVRTVVPFVSPKPESPPESWMRWIFIAAGLPLPEVQFEVVTSSGSRRRRDLAWPKYRVACEYDGVAFHTGDALFADRTRLNEFVLDDWATVHVTNAMIWKSPDQLAGRVDQLLRSRGWHPTSTATT